MKLTRYRSVLSLRTGQKQFAGRNIRGKITVRHRGGGHKQAYRFIDWNRSNTKALVVGFEYDPQRNASLAKLYHNINTNTPLYSYILAPTGIKLFQEIFAYKKQFEFNIQKLLQPGDAAPLSFFESGDFLHAVQSFPGQAIIFGRSAGSFCQVRSHIINDSNNEFAKIRLPSGSQRFIKLTAQATLGVVSISASKKKLVKAGQSRWLGWRPTVRGVAINPVDHPHGGGQGKTSGGRPSVTFKSWPTKGKPTRSKKQRTSLISLPRNKLIYLFYKMARSLWKPNYIHIQVLAFIDTTNEICVQNRSTVVVPLILNKRFQIYNGVRWFAITIQAEIRGHRLGEFAPTRKRPVLKKKKKLISSKKTLKKLN